MNVLAFASALVAAAPRQGLLDRLAGLSRLSLADENVYLGLRYPLPAWAWVAIVLAAGALALWSYSRLLGPRWARMALGGVRALLLLLVVVLIAGPTLVRPDEQVEQDVLLVLVDRSASMQVADSLEPATNEPITRDERLRRAVQRQAAVFAQSPLTRERQVRWLGFDATVRPIAGAADAQDWPAPDAQATALRTAIEQALQSAQGRPISGIVLMSDGRTPQTTGPELVRRLQQHAAPVFAVPVGAPRMPLDLALRNVEAPQEAFANDIVPVNVVVDRFGDVDELDPARVHVRLVDEVTGDVLDERTLEGVAPGAPVRLMGQSDQPGRAQWRVEVALETQPGVPSELIVHNNTRTVAVELIDRPLNVLYVEGYPRWDYRYLKNMLIREESIASSILLLSADRDFAQEGDIPIARLPQTAEEMSRYDVIIFGDVSPDAFGADQLALLRDQVAARGAGLLWIGGERHVPRSYEATALADLLPMQQPGAVERLPADDVALQPTPLAEDLNVMQLRGVAEDASSAADEHWPSDLPALSWVQNLGRLKAAADVLAIAGPGAGDAESPLIARLRYGAGQSLYVATDETWRWRYGRGELYFEQFWLQLVRMLGRERVQQADRQARFAVSHQRVEAGGTVVLELTIDDPALLERRLPRVAVAVMRADQPGQVVEQIELRPVGENHWQTTWRPTAGGEFELRVVEPALDALGLAQSLSVISPDDELRQPQTDHPRLAALAAQTGGAVVPLEELDQLIELAPNRARRTAVDVREPLWHSPLAFGMALVLLTGEWVGRKMIRLV